MVWLNGLLRLGVYMSYQNLCHYNQSTYVLLILIDQKLTYIT